MLSRTPRPVHETGAHTCIPRSHTLLTHNSHTTQVFVYVRDQNSETQLLLELVLPFISDIYYLEKLGHLWLVTNNKIRRVVSITQISMSGRERDNGIQFAQLMQKDRAGFLGGRSDLRSLVPGQAAKHVSRGPMGEGYRPSGDSCWTVLLSFPIAQTSGRELSWGGDCALNTMQSLKA